jgi:hypothetical protein
MIELYTMPKCSGCEMVKRALEAEHIPFRELRLDELHYGASSEILADLRVSGYHDSIEALMSAPIARNPATGDAIPASVLCDGRDIVAEVARIL